jgi:hypothetical protein
MRTFCFTVAAASAFTAAAVGLAGPAAAAPKGGGNAADVVKELQADGYNVQINGSVTDPLSTCVTTAAHGGPAAAGSPDPQAASFTSVYVDVSCPDDH